MRVSATRRIPSLGDRVRRASVHGGGLSRARVASLGAALIGIFCSFGPSAAGAQDASCFGGRSEEAAQRVVDLSERLTPSAECEYSLSRGGPFRALPEALLTQEAGFL
ncbi:MAG: hypothetical protein OEY14_09280, partial [Myxococcales bacterium]|nr:hypothetical protein [Myxococcales bacterium]